MLVTLHNQIIQKILKHLEMNFSVCALKVEIPILEIQMKYRIQLTIVHLNWI